MKLRIYGNIKDTKTNQAVIDTNVKLFLEKKELQKVNSIKNGFFEIITEIDDSRIESGQQLRVTFEKEGYQKQEHRVFTTEGSFNLDVELEPVVPLPSTPKKSFKKLPLIIGGAVLLALLLGGMITWLLLRPSIPQIISFSSDSNSIDIGESVILHWGTKNASTVKIEPGIGEVKPKGDIKVKPARTMEYTLTAMNEEEKFISKALTIEVVNKKTANELLDTSDMNQTKSGGLNIMGSVGIGTKTPSSELEVKGTVTAKAFSGSVSWSDIASIPPGFADKVDNVNDADADPVNEIQTLSSEGNKIALSKGGSVIVPYAVNADKLDGKDASELGSDIRGSGGTNYLAKWSGSKILGTSGIYDNGNVGIGTAGAFDKLTIKGIPKRSDYGGGITIEESRSSGDLKLGINKDYAWIQSHNSKPLVINELGNNVGIGTTSPKSKLHTVGDLVLGLDANNKKFIFHSRTNGNGDFLQITHDNNKGQWNWAQGITLRRGGNVGIGTTNPNAKLQVVGDIRANKFPIFSDDRLKKNITIIENALDKVSALRGVLFEWRTEEYPEKGLDKGQEIGLIAQEVEEVLPNVVSEDNEGYKSLDYSRLSPVLIEAIKDLKAEINELREENAGLKKRIAVLEEKY